MLYDGEAGIKPAGLPKNVRTFDIPINRVAKDVGGSIIMRNTAALGATVALLGGDVKHLKDLIAEEFARKKKTVTLRNQAVAKAGYDFARERYSNAVSSVLTPRKKGKKQIVVTGNEAIALGAIAADMRFAAIYPMTPISNILHTLASHQRTYGFVYKQPEDEISAINMAIGASFAGARSMTATSGSGFCLMTEGYGLAGQTETPVVIVMGMRPGPAIGMPTWTEQGDLRFVLHAHQGDFPRIVLAPGDVEEAFHMTMQAFNLADKYQTPVLLLVDKHLCESHMSVPPFDYGAYRIDRGKFSATRHKSYGRYTLAKDGISARSIPGSGNHVLANSDEHSEQGYSNDEPENRRRQMEKRMQKLTTCEKKDMQAPKLYGPQDADVTLVSWGSNKGAILEALQEFDNVNFLHLTWINPFPAKAVRRVLEDARRVVNIECNYSAQMAGLIAERTGIRITDTLLKYDGRPLYPEEIRGKVDSIFKHSR